MGANAQTSVPTFTAGDVLTAANMNISARTGVPVFANTTARDAAFGGTGEKVLAEGQLCYVENLTGAAQIQYYDGANWVSLTGGGLVYLTGAAFTTATSFSLPNSTFTSTYRNYRIIITVNALTTDSDFTMRLRASGSDDSNSQYRNIWFGYTSLSATDSVVTVPGSAFSMREGDTAASVIYSLVLDVIQPQVATATAIHGQVIFLNKAGAAYVSSMVNGLFTATTQFDALSFISSVASSMTGVYRVYGYADS